MYNDLENEVIFICYPSPFLAAAAVVYGVFFPLLMLQFGPLISLLCVGCILFYVEIHLFNLIVYEHGIELRKISGSTFIQWSEITRVETIWRRTAIFTKGTAGINVPGLIITKSRSHYDDAVAYIKDRMNQA